MKPDAIGPMLALSMNQPMIADQKTAMAGFQISILDHSNDSSSVTHVEWYR
jgi:hypothetical protein